MLCTILCWFGALSLVTYLLTYIIPMFFGEQNLKVPYNAMIATSAAAASSNVIMNVILAWIQ
jgi:hypothetical protein